MILVDSSVWIDHLHRSDKRLVELLGRDEVGSHPFVIEELALGSIAKREQFLGLLTKLWRFPVLSHEEFTAFNDRHELWGRGLSAVDVHLLGATALVGAARLWTRDKRLRAAADASGVLLLAENERLQRR